ncbi:MAG: DUF86 domain-containing protein [Candidatus Pacearchaeota archaeon]
MLDYKIYLKDILDASQRIIDSTKNITKENFEKRSEVWDATLMRLQVIGESIKHIPIELRKNHKEIEWIKLSKLRNIISHTYFGVNKEIIWKLIKEKIPKLNENVKDILTNAKTK